jgi:hypothetical protein
MRLAPPQEASGIPPRSFTGDRRPRVLVVEDNPVNQYLALRAVVVAASQRSRFVKRCAVRGGATRFPARDRLHSIRGWDTPKEASGATRRDRGSHWLHRRPLSAPASRCRLRGPLPSAIAAQVGGSQLELALECRDPENRSRRPTNARTRALRV